MERWKAEDEESKKVTVGVDDIVKMRKEVWPKIEEVGNILVNDT